MSSVELPSAICDYTGLIRGEEIRKAIANDLLLVQETTDDARVRQASYELRLSGHVQFLVLADPADGLSVAKYEQPVGIGKTLTVRPGQTVKAFTCELFSLPTNVVAHIYAIGNVYKLGLSPETTYADPGFDGEFYLTICNYSSRIVELPVDQPIARVEFVKLARSTERPHPGSKHTGEPEFWPRRVERRPTDDLRKIGVDGLLEELEKKDPPHFEQAFIAREVRAQVTEKVADLTKSLERLERQLASLHLVLYGLLILACAALIGTIWQYVPTAVRSKLTEETVKLIFVGLGLGIPLLSRSVWRKVRLAFLGKPDGSASQQPSGGAKD